MNLTYTKVGDYYLPNLTFPDPINKFEIGKYGRLRLQFLKEHNNVEYIILLMDNELREHLISINNEAEKRVKNIIEEMCSKEKVDEDMKTNDQMIWIGLMNNFKNIAEEIVCKEIIYI